VSLAVRGAVASGLTCLACAPCLGCGPATSAQKAQADMATMHKEQTADKLLDRGRGFAAIGDTTRAEEYLAAALEAGADPKETLPILLQVCVQTGRYRSAIQHAENHLRRHPDDVRTRFVLGTLQAAVGDAKEAHATLKVVVGRRPNDSKAHYALAVLARDGENDLVTADQHFREYLRIEPNGDHAEEARASLLQKVPQ
jgi:Tfp pilus assembly protein PilF